jgi:hypothetical protein
MPGGLRIAQTTGKPRAKKSESLDREHRAEEDREKSFDRMNRSKQDLNNLVHPVRPV